MRNLINGEKRKQERIGRREGMREKRSVRKEMKGLEKEKIFK